MPKAPEQTPEEQLDGLRAQLDVAEHAASDVPEDADEDTKAAAAAHKAAAEKALADAHLAAQKREADKDRELRAAEAVAEERITFQEFVQAGTTQNVRGTDALSPEEHAARRNPQHS